MVVYKGVALVRRAVRGEERADSALLDQAGDELADHGTGAAEGVGELPGARVTADLKVGQHHGCAIVVVARKERWDRLPGRRRWEGRRGGYRCRDRGDGSWLR